MNWAISTDLLGIANGQWKQKVWRNFEQMKELPLFEPSIKPAWLKSNSSIHIELLFKKLDGVGPVDNRPSTDEFHQFVKKKFKKMTCDTWHVKCDTWHVTRDKWHVTRLGGWIFSENFSSLALTVCYLYHYEDLEKKADSINELMSNKAVYRTASATPGLLKRWGGGMLF